jgi:hypothetical protein
VKTKPTVTLILPDAQGVASNRATLAGMMVRRHRGGGVMFAPIDARLARAQLGAMVTNPSSRVSR